MKMPAKLKREWVKALKSGEYDQTESTLCNGNGGFCCLGVLEHVAMDGEVEAYNDFFLDSPTHEFYEYAGIEVAEIVNKCVIDSDVGTLMDMNDGNYLKDIPKRSFEEIAEWIKYNVETY